MLWVTKLTRNAANKKYFISFLYDINDVNLGFIIELRNSRKSLGNGNVS